MIIVSCEQGSDEWHAARAGFATASEFSSVLAKGQGITRTKYLRKLVCERLIGKAIDSGYKSADMLRGQEQEQFARAAYEIKTGNSVEKIGFLRHDQIAAGCSPDGWVGKDGGVEIKSVIGTVQIETILSGQYPSEHRAQIQGCMWLCERAHWDFVSFCDDMPDNLQTYIFRVERDETYILKMQAEVTVFLREVDALVTKLQEMT